MSLTNSEHTSCTIETGLQPSQFPSINTSASSNSKPDTKVTEGCLLQQTKNSPENPRPGLLAAHLAAILFGLSGIFGALADASAWVISFGRAFIAALLLAVLIKFLKVPLRAYTKIKLWLLILSGALLASHWVTFFLSIQQSNVAIATLGFASFPAFIVLLEVIFLRDSLSLRDAFLLAMVLCGLVLINPSVDLDSQNTVGLLWGVFSGMSFAAIAVCNRKLSGAFHPLSLSFWQNVIVALCLIALAIPAVPRTGAINWFWILILGTFCTALSHYLFVKSFKYIKARVSGMIIALEPVYAIIFAWILFNQRPTLGMVVGGALILLAAVLPKTRV